MKDTFNKNSNSEIFVLTWAWLIFLYALGFALWTIFYTETGNGDNVEHLHATWLVAHGKIPYLDFFQHHNPLLWYTFAPIITQTTNLLHLLDMAHSIGLVAGILTFFIVYKICRRYFASKALPILLALLILCPPYYYIYCFNYNPDTFMALFYAIGLYYLFSYWEKRNLCALVTAFLAFFAAFMYTQKILIPLAMLGTISLYIFHLKKSPLSDILSAALLPIMGIMLFIALLYHYGALEQYWQSNYPFNIIMQKYYGADKINVIGYQNVLFPVGLAFFGSLCLIKSSSVYFRVIFILFIIELCLRCFYFSIAPYYLLPLMIYCCCINSLIIEKILQYKAYWAYLFLVIGSYYAVISKDTYLTVRTQDRTFARYLAQQITPCDYVISSYFSNQSIISKDPHYYWSMLGHIDLAGSEAGIHPLPNLNELVKQYLPKIIYGGIYWNSYEKHRRHEVAIQQISPKIISQYYLPTPFSEFYILKYEYWHKKCTYNKRLKEWSYED
ncbi:MAG: glycosyltransferase family 39 protein [Alphaproteobacteria bacterium]|nr:glycosyltransferase family 39 protein [Alphaproteobacteria bacterium]